MTGDRITAGERRELGELVRKREKVAKTATALVKARRLADLEVQLASTFSAEDKLFADIASDAAELLKRSNQLIQQRCEERGIPEQFRPELGRVAFASRGENATAARRAELRKVAQAQADADQKEALLAIEAASVEAQTALLREGLDTDAARRFLEAMPTPEQLMPALNLGSLLAALPGHESDEGPTEHYNRWELDRWKEDRAALNEMMNGKLALDAGK